MSDKTYAELLAELSAAREEKAQADGATAELLKQLKEFDLNSLAEARAELARLDKKVARLGREESEAVAAVRRKWKSKEK